MQVSAGTKDFGTTFLGIIYFGVQLPLFTNNISFQVNFTLGVLMEELKKTKFTMNYYGLEGLI